MSHSTDPDLNAALEADAEMLMMLGQDPGLELEDFDCPAGAGIEVLFGEG